jgi:Secretion system C-terminal sorting domain
MKYIFSLLFILPFLAQSQVNYTVTVTKLMAKANICDGGSETLPILCPLAPQDPVFNIWCNDAEANEFTYCWPFENDPELDYGDWKDIQNVELANVSDVFSTYVSFDMEGFESDSPIAPGCSSIVGDDEVMPREFVHMYTFTDFPAQVPFVDVINLNDVYYAEIEIYWESAAAGLFDADSKVDFALFPNPSDGIFNVNLLEDINGNYNVTVMDVTGRVVYSSTSMYKEIQIDLMNQEVGMYFVTLNVSGKTTTRTLVKK